MAANLSRLGVCLRSLYDIDIILLLFPFRKSSDQLQFTAISLNIPIINYIIICRKFQGDIYIFYGIFGRKNGKYRYRIFGSINIQAYQE